MKVIDTRIWQFRVDASGGVDKRIFLSRDAVPADEGWQDSRGEALEGRQNPAPTEPEERPFNELSMAEQVAALEALGGEKSPELAADELAALKEAADADAAEAAAHKAKTLAFEAEAAIRARSDEQSKAISAMNIATRKAGRKTPKAG